MRNFLKKLNQASVKREAKWKRVYHDNGQLWYEVPYITGQAQGTARRYHPNGQLECETPYVNDKKHGMERWYNSEGELETEILYLEGQKKIHTVHHPQVY